MRRMFEDAKEATAHVRINARHEAIGNSGFREMTRTELGIRRNVPCHANNPVSVGSRQACEIVCGTRLCCYRSP
jgi:hypothetical protein